jgi:hypothetical protein
MKARRRTVIAILVAVLGTATVFLIGFHETLYGLAAQRFVKWDEESFNGRLLSDLESNLTKQGRGLLPVDSGHFSSITGRSLDPNQRAMYFTKGKQYRWFLYGTAINVGYVVAEKEGEVEKVVAIIRARSVDSL